MSRAWLGGARASSLSRRGRHPDPARGPRVIRPGDYRGRARAPWAAPGRSGSGSLYTALYKDGKKGLVRSWWGSETPEERGHARLALLHRDRLGCRGASRPTQLRGGTSWRSGSLPEQARARCQTTDRWEGSSRGSAGGLALGLRLGLVGLAQGARAAGGWRWASSSWHWRCWACGC